MKTILVIIKLMMIMMIMDITVKSIFRPIFTFTQSIPILHLNLCEITCNETCV